MTKLKLLLILCLSYFTVNAQKLDSTYHFDSAYYYPDVQVSASEDKAVNWSARFTKRNDSSLLETVFDRTHKTFYVTERLPAKTHTGFISIGYKIIETGTANNYILILFFSPSLIGVSFIKDESALFLKIKQD
jgi:hypothetical protein